MACRKAVGRLAALADRIDDMADGGYLASPRLDGTRASRARASMVEAAAIREERIAGQLRETSDSYSGLLWLAQASFSEFEAAGAALEGDIEVLDYYYLQRRTMRWVARRMGISYEWARHKKSMAIERYAPFAPLTW